MTGALLALAASFSWGSSNYIAGVESRTRSAWHVATLSQLAAALASAVALLLVRQPLPGAQDVLMLLLAGVATAAGLVMFYRALAIGPMSVVSPIIAGEVLIPVAAGIAMGERPGLHAYAGMAVTLAGMVLVTRTGPGAHQRVSGTAIVLALLTAVCWGFMLLVYGTTARAHPVWGVFDTRVTSAAVLAAYVLLTGRGLSLKGENLPALAAVGVLLTAANFLFAVAARFGDLSVVAILGSLSPVVVTAYAQVLLRERLTVRQWTGFAAVLAGIVLLSV